MRTGRRSPRKAPARDAVKPTGAPPTLLRTPALFRTRSPALVTESMSISPGAVTDVTRAVDGDGEIELSVVMPCLNEADTLATCIAQGAARAARARHRRRGHRRRQRQHRRLAGDRRARWARASCRVARARLRQRADGRHRGRARPLRHHGRRRRQLRLPRAPEVRRQAPRGLRPGAGLPAAERGGGTRAARARCRCCTAGWGNPMFSLLARRWFRAPIHDVYCGMRGFTQGAATTASTSAARAWSSRPR